MVQINSDVSDSSEPQALCVCFISSFYLCICANRYVQMCSNTCMDVYMFANI